MTEDAGGPPPAADHDADLARFPLRVPAESGPAQALDRLEILRARLEVLRAEHRRLDAEVALLAAAPGRCALTLQRMKRQKLALKDRIACIEDELTPDIIA